MQLSLQSEPDIRAPGDAECLQARLRMIRGATTDRAVAEKRLRRETQDMISGGWRYWMCRDTRMARRLGPKAPEVLVVQGTPDLSAPLVAVVGPRRPDGYGMEMAMFFAESLGRCGVTVVSGGAVGIDTIAHRSALNAGGRTICVPGGGFKRPFPISNVELFSRLGRDDGFRDSCMISEYSPSESASRHHFPERNRIVAALADAVLVIQAGFGSGAMITADLALEMCIPVFAVPADIHYSSSAATNDLLGRGGRPMCRPGDLETVVNLAGSGLSGFNRKPVRRTSGLGSPWISRGASGRSTRHADGSDAQVILEAVRSILSETGRAVDQDSICRQTGLDVARVQAGLLELELGGGVQRLPGALFMPRPGG